DRSVAECDFEVLCRRELPVRIGGVFEDGVLVLVVANPDATRLRVIDAGDLNRRRSLTHGVALEVDGLPQRGRRNHARHCQPQSQAYHSADVHSACACSVEEEVTSHPPPDDSGADPSQYTVTVESHYRSLPIRLPSQQRPAYRLTSPPFSLP